jgi:putative PIN family toxin of toxin-antitoxin system
VPRRLTADTNVYISALNFGGIPETILALARAGLWDVAISLPILAEVERVLSMKFHYTSAMLTDALEEIKRFATLVHPLTTLDVIKADPSDNRILECALSSQSECVVTGDSHLLTLQEYEGIAILSPAEFLDLSRRRKARR